MTSSTASWVDHLHMKPILTLPSSSTTPEFNIVSFNVLAQSYLSSRSHPGLPPSYADVAFDNKRRTRLLIETLKRFCGPNVNAKNKWDILAMQELDLLLDKDQVLPELKSWGYEIVHTPTDQRRDSCAVIFDKNKFRLVDQEIVKFDDLAVLYANSKDCNSTGDTRHERQHPIESQTFNTIRPNSESNPELTGMVRSFLRRNCAILAHLEAIDSRSGNQSILVASVHLYWHPGYEYVKLCQSKYLLDRAYAMSIRNQKRIPTIICGDMNSKPGSAVHQLFVKGDVDGRSVAPWCHFWDENNEVMYIEDNDRLDEQDPVTTSDDLTTNINNYMSMNRKDGGVSKMKEQFQFCHVIDSNANNQAVRDGSGHHYLTSSTVIQSDTSKLDMNSEYNELQATVVARKMKNRISPQDYQHLTPSPTVKYMLDFTLNRFTRWLRILGIDARLETNNEEKERTQGKRIALFDHCKRERRTLLTTSYKLLLRKDCPPGAYLIDTKSLSLLEQALPRLLRTHGVELTPRTFLTRCVVCNGNINRVSSDEEKRSVFIEHGAPDLVDTKKQMEVFRCDGCSQGYWWDDRPSSSASRVFAQATRLFRICLRGGVKIKYNDSLDDVLKKDIMGAFDFIVTADECKHWNGNKNRELAVIEWLREEKLSNPFRLCSAYHTKISDAKTTSSSSGESLPFSNVTKEFVGLLDYVFYDDAFQQTGRLDVPTSFKALNTSELPAGHLLPSNIWPSDHLVVGARLRLKKAKPTKKPRSIPEPLSHPPRCACGCVPNILSLFEMAELRKKARDAAKAVASNT